MVGYDAAGYTGWEQAAKDQASIINYWGFEETSGTNCDDEIGSNDATSTSMVLNQTSLLSSGAGKCWKTDASSDNILLYQPSATSFTIGFLWMGTGIDTSNRRILGAANTGAAIGLQYDDDAASQFTLKGRCGVVPTNWSTSFSYNVDNSDKIGVIITWDGTNVVCRLYKAGVQVAEHSFAPTIGGNPEWATGGALYFNKDGASAGDAEYYFDEAFFCNAALTEAVCDSIGAVQ